LLISFYLYRFYDIFRGLCKFFLGPWSRFRHKGQVAINKLHCLINGVVAGISTAPGIAAVGFYNASFVFFHDPTMWA
jgi:hypothetical protein